MRYWVAFHYGNDYKATGPTVFASMERAIKFITDYIESPIRTKDELMAKGVSIEDKKEESISYIPIFPKAVLHEEQES